MATRAIGSQLDKAPQVCGLTAQQIADLKKLVDQFQNENAKNNPPILKGVVPKVAVANCVRVDNFKPTCGLTAAQLSQVSAQIAAYKSQPPNSGCRAQTTIEIDLTLQMGEPVQWPQIYLLGLPDPPARWP